MKDGGGLENRRAWSGITRLPLFWAAIATILVLAWQMATVQANYSGNLTGLFHTGAQMKVPPDLIATTFRDASPNGYDGQFYRFLAHDPFLRKGTAASLDAPLLRSRRILVPVLAWAIALGQPRLIDGAYVLVLAGFIFGGVYWLGCVMLLESRPAAAGLVFLIVPATIVSIDRVTVDVALAALTAGLIWQFASGREFWIWPMLSAAVLVRETGLILLAACALAALFKGKWKKALVWLSAAIPALCWYAYLHDVLPTASVSAKEIVPSWVFPTLRLGIFTRLFHPLHYHFSRLLEIFVQGLDGLALIGMIGTAAMAVCLLRHMPDLSWKVALGLHAAFLVALTAPGFWNTPFGYTRPFGPLFVLVLGASAARRGYWALGGAVVFSLLIDLRISAEIRSQILPIGHFLFSRLV